MSQATCCRKQLKSTSHWAWLSKWPELNSVLILSMIWTCMSAIHRKRCTNAVGSSPNAVSTDMAREDMAIDRKSKVFVWLVLSLWISKPGNLSLVVTVSDEPQKQEKKKTSHVRMCACLEVFSMVLSLVFKPTQIENAKKMHSEEKQRYHDWGRSTSIVLPL